MIKQVTTSVIAAIVVLLIGLGIYHPKQIVTQVTQAPATKGAPDLSNSPYININGVTEWRSTVSMNTASSSICKFTAPSASSTLQYVSFNVTGNTNPNALEIDIGTSSAFANSGTTTGPLIKNLIVPASAGLQGGYQAASFITAQVYPGQGVNVVVATSTYATTPYNGYCQAVFMQN